MGLYAQLEKDYREQNEKLKKVLNEDLNEG